MALLGVGDVLRNTVICQNSTQYSQNVCNFIVTQITGSFTDTQYVEQMSAAWSNALVPLLSANASYQGLRVIRVFGGLTQPVTSTNGASVGDIAGDCLPPQTAAVIKKLTNVGGRRGRGRFYVPFPSETHSTAAGIVAAAYVGNSADLQTLIKGETTLNDGANQLKCVMVLYTQGEPAATIRLVTDCVLRGAWGTQRRRSFINKGDASPL